MFSIVIQLCHPEKDEFFIEDPNLHGVNGEDDQTVEVARVDSRSFEESPYAVYEGGIVTFYCISDTALQILSSYISLNNLITELRWRCLCINQTFPKCCRHQLRTHGLSAIKSIFDPLIASTVRTLDLNSCGLDEKNILRLLSALNNSTIFNLSLKHNNLNDGLASQLSSFISSNSNLKSLNISRNSFTYKTIMELSEVLRLNPNLLVLDVSFNPLRNRGLILLLDSIRSPCGLKEVYAQYCEGSLFRERSVFSRFYDTINDLVEIDLTGNRVHQDDVASLSSLLQDRSLASVKSRSNSFLRF
jgi:Ran GTPase-activating protein (RanGAP) involved in mRNA processing and transport